jgi:phosphoglycerate dehydrogenase-like enzyme
MDAAIRLCSLDQNGKATAPAQPAPAGGPSAPARAAIALDPEELNFFFSSPAGGVERLFKLLPQARVLNPSAPGADWPAWLKADPPEILVTSWSTALIPADLTGLRYVCHVGGSVRKTVPRVLIERGVLVSNWGDTVSEGLAEAALSALRRSHFYADLMHCQRGWSSYPTGTRSLFGRRVGIHGFGFAARKLVGLLAPFRVRISACSENVPDHLFRDAGVERCSSLDELFSQSEVLFELEALTPATEGSVTAQLLQRLPPDAVFVNVARGALVDEAAAARLAAEGRIRLALDVYRQEPLPENSPLRDLPEAVLFPHVGSPTDDRLHRCGDFALANLERYLRHEPLAAPISLEIFDRST